ncbi:MAG: aldo/keto reductase [Acidimicrobiales bacterium]
MNQRLLGHDGLETSDLGLGCMGFSQGYGPADDAESVRAIQRSIELGVTLLDTAMSYGQGHNEELVGRVLAEHRDSAERLTIATKLGIVRGDDGVYLDGRPDHVAGYCDASLARLGVEVIDLYYLHRVDPEVPIAETVSAMAELVVEGKVRHLGVCEVTPDQLREAAGTHPISALQLEWSLLWREPEDDIIPVARQLGVGIVPYSPLGRGLLTGTLTHGQAIDSSDFRQSDPRFHGDDLAVNLAQIETLRAIASDLGITAGQLALAWLLAQGPDVVPIPGSRHADRVAENAAAAAVTLSEADVQRVDMAVPRSGWSGDRRSFAVPGTARASA